jgi:iron complex outermembrane receptor protein
VFTSFGRSQNHSTNNSGVVTARLTQVLAGASTNIPAFNPFCDVKGCNSPVTIGYIRSWNTTNYILDRKDFSGSLSGPLFSLPGGDVRMAIGGEYIEDDFISYNENTNSGSLVVTNARHPTRKIEAAFGEILLPIFGPENATTGFRELELSAAVRFERYSDFGRTTNPKFGVSWVPVDGLKLRGSYGTSFHAPVLSSNNPNAQAGLLSGANSTVLTADIASTDFNGTNASYRATWVIGGNGGLKPETAETYSFGADWDPAFAPRLRLSVNYFNVSYTNKIDYPAYNAGATAAILSSYLQPYVYPNPTFFPTSATMTQTEWNSLLGALLNGTAQPANSPFDTVPRVVLGPAPTASTTIALIDARRNNTGIVTTDGLDLSANYQWDDSFASWNVGAVGTWVFSYKNSVAPGAPTEQQVNTFGAPLRFSARGDVSAEIGNLTTALFVNFQNSYKIARRYIPRAAPDHYLNIGAYATADLSVTYRFCR